MFIEGGYIKFYSIVISVRIIILIQVIFYSSISYLPLAHIYERTNQVISVYSGVAVGFYQGV